MLLDLLNLLRTGRTRSLTELARVLGTSVEMVEAMLEDLGRMGHVHEVSAHRANSCDAACQSCPRSGECVQGSSGRIWTVNPG
jgi:predicted transcriptional regulator